jgi:biopolymer transport protein ExbD
MKFPRSRTSRRGRIEIIPMIDVMFFLLATFMLASLSMQNLHSLGIDLPRGKAAEVQARVPITLSVTREGKLRINDTEVSLEDLQNALRPLLVDPEKRVIIAADSQAAHGLVIQAMLQARQAGAERFLVAVKNE